MSALLELNAPLELAKLGAHYAAQLEHAGWTRDEEGQSGPIAWHTWAFQDEDHEACCGFFFLLRVPGQKEQYRLHVQINWDIDGGQSSGSFVQAPMTRLT